MCRLAAPALLFKSEAIVHPDEVVQYIGPGECQLSYNPLQMALIWDALATREVRLLAQALERRHHIPDGTAWVNYVRCHDDIGWTFADEDAAELGIDGFDHRRFLNAFYVNRFAGSFARGVPFQENPRTGDCRVSGTTASLAGLEAGDAVRPWHGSCWPTRSSCSTGGIPLLYLGDEVGQLERLRLPPGPGQGRGQPLGGPAGVPGGAVRGAHGPGDGRREDLRRADPPDRRATADPRVRGRPAGPVPHPQPPRAGLPARRATSDGVESTILVLANFGDTAQHLDAATLGGMPDAAEDLIGGGQLPLRDGLTLEPHGIRWLRV